MNGYCTNCGSQLEAEAGFCTNCGNAVADDSTAADSGTEAAAPSNGTAQSEAPTATVVEAPAPPASPRTAPPEPSGGKSRKGLLIGGLLAASVLGLVAILVVGAALYFFALPGSESSGGGGEPGGSGGGGGEQEPAPSEGSLQQMVEEQVGDFALAGVEEDPEPLSWGATDALVATYDHSDGTELFHNLASYPSPEDADADLQAEVDYWTSDEGFEVVEESPVEIDGEEVGTVFRLQGDFEIVTWTNGSLRGGAGGPEGYAADFYINAPY